MGGALATITEVAREAGVSVSTVSHVVNGTGRVAPATARAVQAVINSIGYSPNALARALKTASTRSVGIAISAISNPYFSDIICAIETECARLGLMVFLSDTEDDPTREMEVVKALHQRRVDGMILAPSADPEHRALAYLRAARLPCVLVDRTPDPAFDQVGVNNREAMRMLVDHVAARGTSAHRLSSAAIRASRRRSSASSDTAPPSVIEASPSTSAILLPATPPHDARPRATHALLALPDPPTALVAGNNMATIGVMQALRARGLRVPRDISVAGFDDFEWADCFEPRLTLVAQPCVEIGKRAASLLMERIAKPQGAPRTILLDATLIERDSCGAPR